MELKRRFWQRNVFICLFIFMFAVYLFFGLQFAEATNYEISATLEIPSLNIESDVTKLRLIDHELKAPETIVGSFSKNENKTLLIGHSSTVFEGLDKVQIGATVVYDEDMFTVTDIEMVKKSDINMNTLLRSAEKRTIIIMTCAGERVGEADATHRLIITAEV